MKTFVHGLKQGIPIALGYFAVSFAFGVMTRTNGFSPLVSTIISLTNLTSSGQFAGVEMMLEHASYFEIGLAVLLINLRYSLMSISLSQKIDPKTPKWQRLLYGFGITDEVFAIAFKEEKGIKASYMAGLILLPIVGWTLGTLVGSLSSQILPPRLLDAMGIALYAMFIAIFVPDAKKSLSISLVIGVGILLSVSFTYVPYIKEISIGFKIIISTLLASLFGALVFPRKEDVNDGTSN